MQDPATGEWNFYHYDDRGLLVKIEHALGGETRFAHDAMARPLTREMPNGTVDLWFYDQAGRTAAIVRLGAPGNQQHYPSLTNFALHQEPSGRTLQRDQQAYLQLAQRIQQQVQAYPGKVLQTWQVYQYDANSNVSVRGINGHWYNHGYDFGTNQLLLTERPSQAPLRHEWDAVGNMTRVQDGRQTTQLTYDAANRLRSRSGDGNSVPYHYDANGNLLQKGDAWSADSHWYRYDAMGRLLQVETQEGNRATANYGYDALDRRTQSGFSTAANSLNWQV